MQYDEGCLNDSLPPRAARHDFYGGLLLEHDALVSAAAALALGVEVILTPPCIIY